MRSRLAFGKSLPFSLGALATLSLAIGCSSRLHTPAPIAGSTALGRPTTRPGLWALNPQNTHISFIGSALLISHEGTFTSYSGEIDCPGTDPAQARLFLTIDTTSIYTEIPLLTKHLKESDFFDVAKYPIATFTVTVVQPHPDGNNTHLITGNLTLHGKTRTLTFPARVQVLPHLISLDAATTVRQSDFDMQSARITTDQVPVTASVRIARP